MYHILIYISFCIAHVFGSGELIILHHPEGLLFKGHERLDQSDLKEVYSAALGFSLEQSSSWSGIYITNPFKLSEAIVSIFIDGINNLNIHEALHYPLRTDEDEDITFESVKRRIKGRHPYESKNIVDINLSNDIDEISVPDIFGGIKKSKFSKNAAFYLKADIEEDRQFLEEIEFLNAISKHIEKGAIKRNLVSNFYGFKVLSLHAVSDLHGENSTATKEAKKMLIQAINRLNHAFVKAFDSNVFVTVITSDVSHTRRTRSVTDNGSKATNAEISDINIAKSYNSDYPVIFNIILWFGVIMVFTLLAICVAIGEMDPGRDSIIYRMTSTRMKKDN